MEIASLKICSKDLDEQGTLNYWRKKSCFQAEKDIVEHIITMTGSMPCKNMALVKSLCFRIRRDTTIPELRSLGDKISRCFGIECFQISIDRENSTASMLFDFVDRKTSKSIYMNTSDRKLLAALIIKELNSDECVNDPMYLRYKILLEYKEDPNIFSKCKGSLANAGLGQKGYTVMVDILNYMEHICNGRTVIKSL